MGDFGEARSNPRHDGYIRSDPIKSAPSILLDSIRPDPTRVWDGYGYGFFHYRTCMILVNPTQIQSIAITIIIALRECLIKFSSKQLIISYCHIFSPHILMVISHIGFDASKSVK